MSDREPTPPGSRSASPERLVAIGASAGGLEALEKFFAAVGADADAAFVVVQHLSPDYKSMMDALLSRHTAMPVVMAEHDMPLRAGHVFLIPPGMTMTLAEGRLKLSRKPPNQLVLPIDVFLRSAAEAYRERLVAVILSGTGSDGSRGAATVKANGGYVLAQNPDTARFDGMPRSAAATGLVHAVLTPGEMPAAIAGALAAPGGPRDGVPRTDPASEDEAYVELMALASRSSSVDLANYKRSTVMRRIGRRLSATGCESLRDYLRLARRTPDEVDQLARELLISVTRFFRDREVFAALQAEVVRPLVAPATPEAILRAIEAVT